MMKKYFLTTAISILFSLVSICYANSINNINKSVNHIINQALTRYKVPAASIAIIENNKIVLAKAYINSSYSYLKVTPNTMFQAASISKAISAFAALRLAQNGKLKLDENINKQLTSWKVPNNKFTAKTKVTVQEILNMTSGLSVHGFPGYSVETKLPSLIDILNGQPPANSKPIRVIFTPGTKYSYSSGGFLVLQQLMMGVTHQTFPVIMKNLVLNPLNMKHSLYTKALSRQLWSSAVPGFHSMKFVHGKMIEGKWHNYPELAAASLWTTPTDLARFVINIIQSYQNNRKGLLSQKMAKIMLARQKNSFFGLGVAVNGKGKSLNFEKGGANLGYLSYLIGFPNTGQGVVIMINSNNNKKFLISVLRKLRCIFSWPAGQIKHNRWYKTTEEGFAMSILSK